MVFSGPARNAGAGGSRHPHDSSPLQFGMPASPEDLPGAGGTGDCAQASGRALVARDTPGAPGGPAGRGRGGR
eukprot:15435248-Alexandrium_andersonii.AAC.1